MIKGINKQILEVTNTDSPYFERIIFFVRPESQALSTSTLETEAEKISKSAQRPPRVRKRFKDYLTVAVFAALGIGAGFALTVIMGSIV